MAQCTEKIKKEKQRVYDEIFRFRSIISSIEERRYKGPHLENLKMLMETCFDVLSSDMDAYLERSISNLPLREASNILSCFRIVIKDLVDFFYVVASNSQNIPRELYYLVDAFLARHKVSTDRYIVFISDEMAVHVFRHILELLDMPSWFPFFWNKMKNVNFYFINILSDLSRREAALNWPIVLHEAAHIVCYEREAYQLYLPKTSIFEALKLAQEEIIPKKAQKKLYVAEYLADLLVTRCAGAIYGWRFLEMYGTYGDILAPGKGHPPPDKRLLMMAREIQNELSTPKSAYFLRKELRIRTKEWPTRPTTNVRLVNVNYILKKVIPFVRKYNPHILTPSQIKKSILESSWFRVLKEYGVKKISFKSKSFQKFLISLQEKLIEGAPIIVDPFTLYYIFTLEFANPKKFMRIVESRDKRDKRIRELIADCIRLHAVEKQFLTEIQPIDI